MKRKKGLKDGEGTCAGRERQLTSNDGVTKKGGKKLILSLSQLSISLKNVRK